MTDWFTTPAPANAAADPFATSAPASDPFATNAPASDPFATSAPASDPFATGAPASDPFATNAPASDPFATPAPASDPFGIGAPSADPFGAPTTAASTESKWDQFVKEQDPAKAFRFLLDLDESCLSRHPEIKDMCKLIKRMGGVDSNMFQKFFYKTKIKNSPDNFQPVAIASGILKEEYEKAKKENPAPKELRPVHSKGFEDLKKQQEKTHEYLKIINKTFEQFDNLHKENVGMRQQFEKRYLRCKEKQKNLQERMLQVVGRAHKHLMQIESTGQHSLTPEEKKLKRQVREELSGLSKHSMLLNQLQSRERVQEFPRDPLDIEFDDGALENVKQFLNNMRQGMEYLMTVVKKCSRDITLMESEYGTARANRGD